MSILIVVVTGKYEYAIMQPKEKEDARHVLGLTLRIAIIACLVLLPLCFLLGDFAGNFYNNPELGKWLWLLPVALFPFAVFNAMNYWFSREKNYRVAATSKVYFTCASEPMKIATGLGKMASAGLLMSAALGNIVAGIYTYLKFKKSEPAGLRNLSGEKMREMAVAYKDYPLYTIWGSLFNRTAQWAHIGMFSFYFGPYAIGFMALSRRVFMNPLNILASSYSQVFYQRISEIDKMGELRSIYVRSVLKFSLIGALMIVFVQLLPEQTMAVIFGAQWGDTLVFLKILCFWYAINFVTSAHSFIFYKLAKQRITFLLDLLHLVVVVLAILISFYIGLETTEALMITVAVKFLYLLFTLIIAIFLMRNDDLPAKTVE